MAVDEPRDDRSAHVQRKSPSGKLWGQVYEVYTCMGRLRDVHACRRRPVPRAAVDQAALWALEQRGISIEQTRAGLLESLAAERTQVVARLDDARRQERKATEALERIDRDYADGALPAVHFERLHPRLEEELAGARAAREQVEHRLAAIADDHVDDARAATIANLREAIAAHLRDGANVDEVRMLLRRPFARFVLRTDPDGLALVPELRPDALSSSSPAPRTAP